MATALGRWAQLCRGPFDTLARAGNCPPRGARRASLHQPCAPWSGFVPDAGTPTRSACPTGRPLTARDILGWQRPELAEVACTWARETAAVPRLEAGFQHQGQPPASHAGPTLGACVPAGHARAAAAATGLLCRSLGGRQRFCPWPARQKAPPPPRAAASPAVTCVLAAAVRGVGFTCGRHPVGSLELGQGGRPRDAAPTSVSPPRGHQAVPSSGSNTRALPSMPQCPHEPESLSPEMREK